ncbi:MAG: hypothetical protein ABJN26_09950 [Stappiaceae bacterium]
MLQTINGFEQLSDGETELVRAMGQGGGIARSPKGEALRLAQSGVFDLPK